MSSQPEHPPVDSKVEPDAAYVDDSYTYQGSPGPVTPDRVTTPEPIKPMPAPAPPAASTGVPAVVPPANLPSGPRKPPPSYRRI